MTDTTDPNDATPTGGAEGEALRPEEQTAFLRSVENVRSAATLYLVAHRDEAAVIAFVRNLQDGVDRLVAEATRAGKRIDCAAGCSHCCQARVEASAPEIFEIAAEVDRRPAADRVAMLERLERWLATAPAPSTTWRDRPGCPFLVDHLCSIYAVRPTACRKAHSGDVARCASYAPSIPQDLEVALGAQALVHGTALAYGGLGVDATGHELVSAVAAALRDPSMRTRWFAGESVFVTAAAGSH